FKCADDCLESGESSEIASLIDSDQRIVSEHLELLSLEAVLRAGRKDFDLCDSIVERLQRERAESIEAKVIARIQGEPVPRWHSPPSKRLRFRIPRPAAARVLALAAGVVLLLSIGIWFFGPKMGEPVLSALHADVLIERGTEPLPVLEGIRLQA